MAASLPVVATDVGGNRELIRDGINGFLAKAPTVELLDETMNRAWENQHRLREMGETAATDVLVGCRSFARPVGRAVVRTAVLLKGDFHA